MALIMTSAEKELFYAEHIQPLIKQAVAMAEAAGITVVFDASWRMDDQPKIFMHHTAECLIQGSSSQAIIAFFAIHDNLAKIRFILDNYISWDKRTDNDYVEGPLDEEGKGKPQKTRVN